MILSSEDCVLVIFLCCFHLYHLISKPNDPRFLLATYCNPKLFCLPYAAK